MSLSEFPLANGERRFLEYRLRTHQFPQTVLIEGGGEEARRALARFLASALVCTGENARPCGVCRACRKCRSGNHPDVQCFAPEKKNGVFKVETCRAIRQDAFVLPNDGDAKVYILEDCQSMNDSSENALLKILEEPPAGVYFLLTCPSGSAMLPTVRSRAVTVTLSGFEEPFSKETQHTAGQLASALCARSEWALLQATAPLERDREETGSTLRCLAEILEDALRSKAGAAARTGFGEVSAQLAAQFTKPRLYAVLREVQKLLSENEGYANANLLLTGLCYRLHRAAEQTI